MRRDHGPLVPVPNPKDFDERRARAREQYAAWLREQARVHGAGGAAGMLTSKPQKKRRGRQPPDYGPRKCPWCATKLKLAADGLYCQNVEPKPCGWKE